MLWAIRSCTPTVFVSAPWRRNAAGAWLGTPRVREVRIKRLRTRWGGVTPGRLYGGPNMRASPARKDPALNAALNVCQSPS